MRHIFVRGLSAARSAMPPGSGMRIYYHAAHPDHELSGDCYQLPHRGLSGGSESARAFRIGPRGTRRRPGNHRPQATRTRRILHIRNTLHLEEVEISEPCLSEPSKATTFSVLGSATALSFDAQGNLSQL